MNIIGLDISINSTALTIVANGNMNLFNYTTAKADNKWVKAVGKDVTFRYIEYKKGNSYTDSEIDKLACYDSITDLIISDILSTINSNQETKINIEGYSYASNTNSVIDIVGFSTLLRIKLYNQVSKNINIFSPKTVKLQTSISVYGYQPAPVGKNGQLLKDPMVTCNYDGIAGGKFDKPEMLKAMVDGSIKSPIFDFICEHKDEILSLKKIPKPFDDIIDSIHIANL